MTPGGFWLVSIRVIGAGQLGAPSPPGWPLWRATYLCTILPLRML